MKTKILMLCIALVLAGTVHTVEASPIIYTKILTVPNVELRPGSLNPVTSDVKVIIWSNKPFNEQQNTLLSSGKINIGIPGWANTANVWNETANLVLDENNENKDSTKFFVAINMPTSPNEDLFGNLNLDDYTNATVGVMNILSKDYGGKTNFMKIISHSQGCSVHAEMENILQKQGTSLKEKFGVTEDSFIACAPMGRTANWTFAEHINLNAFVTAFGKYDPSLGYYISLDPYNWIGMFFLNRSGVLQNAPTLDQTVEYNVAAPFAASMQLIGWRLAGPNTYVYDPIHMKLDLPTGLFDNRKEDVKVYCMAEDTLITTDECQNVYRFLIGTEKGIDKNVINVTGYGAVHSLVVTNPGMILLSEG